MNKRLYYRTALILLIGINVFGFSCKKDPLTIPTYIPVIGDFKFGGVIFYIDETGEHGLVCAVKDTVYGTPWGCSGTNITGADGTGIGDGVQNTQDIVTGCTLDITPADLCANASYNGYSDWFLPSLDELSEMYDNKAAINSASIANGGFNLANDNYWSSSEYSNDNAIYFDFSNGNFSNGGKSGTVLYTRAIREF